MGVLIRDVRELVELDRDSGELELVRRHRRSLSEPEPRSIRPEPAEPDGSCGASLRASHDLPKVFSQPADGGLELQTIALYSSRSVRMINGIAARIIDN